MPNKPKFAVGDIVTSPSIISVKSKILRVFRDCNNDEIFYICKDEDNQLLIPEKKLKIYKEIVQMCEKHNELMLVGSRRVVGIVFSLCRSCDKESELSHAE